MEPTRVDLHNWPHDCGAGGWVMPHGDPIDRWEVIRVHARYVAPRVEAGTVDEQGRRLKMRFEAHAYLVDLDGSFSGLPDYERVLLHQEPPGNCWYIKAVDDDYLERIDRYKVG
ncbi:hypothetical protein [Nonomuraea guangzhouensis]|uniref:Uncharacterized protein n=1 Tax=Nonomuraea guangzhouensis TaxID=1291555 RepID=A0ABW4GVW6_9ACTN|nr:hypothetical protein [Nonomuraea guangzhouensis]